MGFADTLDERGGFGRFQFIHVALLSIPGLLMASQNLLNNFTAGMPGHRCSVPNRTSLALSHNVSLSELSDARILQAFIPTADGSRLSKCRRYTEAQWHLVETDVSNVTEADTETCPDGWTYEKTEFLNAVVTEARGEVCVRTEHFFTLLHFLRASVHLSGSVPPCRFGRRALLVWSRFQPAALGTCTALSPSYLAYCIFLFVTGMSVSGVILNAFSLSELPANTRTVVAVASSFFISAGDVLLVGIAYCVPRWLGQLQCCVALVSRWCPESPRWLVVNGRPEKALKGIHQVARWWKICFQVLEAHMEKEVKSKRTIHTAYDSFRSPGMRKISICLMFSTSFARYGPATDLQKFGADIYLVQLIFGAVDLPATLGTFATLNFLGRRVSPSASLMLSAAVILTNTFVSTELQTERTAPAVPGKGFTSASFTCVYLYTGELYPTVIRRTGMGFSSTVARVGSVAAPAVLILEDVLPALPSIIYGGSAVLARTDDTGRGTKFGKASLFGLCVLTYLPLFSRPRSLFPSLLLWSPLPCLRF
uniref:Solute carrier family 22 member 6-like n=1 Tax=Scleropages formosus TaxID=113540 RepID=A0A8C9V8D4_SCLFO